MCPFMTPRADMTQDSPLCLTHAISRTMIGLCHRCRPRWPFCRTTSGVRLCWELEEPTGPKGLDGCRPADACRVALRNVRYWSHWSLPTNRRTPRALCTEGLDPRDLKTALLCISFLRKGEVLAYAGRIHNLNDLKDGCRPRVGNQPRNSEMVATGAIGAIGALLNKAQQPRTR